MTKYYLLAFLLLFITLFMLLVQLRNRGIVRLWLKKIPMPILVMVLIWLCNELIFLDRTLGWYWVQAEYCSHSGVSIYRKIPNGALLVLEPASVFPDPGYQTLEKWISIAPLDDSYQGDFFIDVVNPTVILRPRFAGDVSSTTMLTWQGKSAAGVCLHMRKRERNIEILSECGGLLAGTKRPIIRVRDESPVGINKLGIFNVMRYSMKIFDSSGLFVEVNNYKYGGGWLAKTIPPGEDSFMGKVTTPIVSDYSCISNYELARKFSIEYWIKEFTK